MKQNFILPDDPRLTAYALGEMAAAERPEFEQLLAADATARQAVAEIRATAAALHGALEQEPSFAEPTDGRPSFAEAMDARPSVAIEPKKDPYAKVTRFPYWKISGLAAACFAVFFVYWQAQEVPRQEAKMKHYIEVPLGAASAAVDAEKESKSKAALELGLVASTATEPLKDKNEITFTVPKLSLASPEPLLAKSANAQYGASVPRVAKISEGVRGGVLHRERRAYGSNAVSGDFTTEAYAYRKESDFARVAEQPLSTFSIDVDTAAYANVRRFLTQGRRPPVDAVRVEELINYFPYDYAGPEAKATVPFAAHLEVAGAPWAPEHRLVRIGLKGREVSEAARPAANLVFLLDVSGSMNTANKLPLVKQSLRLLVDKLRPDDRVAIAVYAGASGLALPSTPVARKAEILDAIERLQAEGSTNGAMGIHLAYDVAKANFIPGGVNRVLLATDGDFNVGVTSEGELMRLVGEKAKSGVFLSVLGFGMGNLKDSTLEQLADKGNGNYAYIDTLAEAKKCLVEQAGGTLVTIAKDVKIQVEFNPAQVAAYRLIGYENRVLAKEEFNDDKIDAGEIGAGHTVTALYEIVPVGVAWTGNSTGVDDLKYQPGETPNTKFQRPNWGGESSNAQSQTSNLQATNSQRSTLNAQRSTAGELLTVKIRYKEPAGEVSSKLEFALRDEGRAFAEASRDFKFAAAVAGFGMVLRDSPHRGGLTLADVTAWGRAGVGSDAGGYRTEFLGLVERAKTVVQ